MKTTDLISECTAYDFKIMLEEKRPKSWLKSVSAFANGLGGSLFIGVDNDGIVKGLDDIQRVCETISNKIRDYMDPLPEVEMIPHKTDEGMNVLQLKVNAGNYTPIMSVMGNVSLLYALEMKVCLQQQSIWYDWFSKAQIKPMILLSRTTERMITLLSYWPMSLKNELSKIGILNICFRLDL